MGKGEGRGAAQVPQLMSREDRVTSFGIDCVDALEWRKWQTGGEYIRQLLVKNVSNKTQKIKYKLPATKYFSMEFPEVIKLSPGMSYNITVVFRPVRHEPYEDYVEVLTTRGSFIIPIRAVLPTVNMQVPANLEFGYCPAKEAAKRTFQMVNTGELEVSFAWKISTPFMFSPSNGRLAPGETCHVEATFTPEDASVFTASAICLLDGDLSLSTNVSGIGKFPYLALSGSTAEFGDVLVGRTSDVMLRLSNYSLVTASFTIKPRTSDGDNVFEVAPTSGVLAPNSFEMVRVSYTPVTSGTFSSESFKVDTPGGNGLELVARGNAAQPEVSLSAAALNFGNVEVGQSSSRVIYIENSSDVVVAYQVVTDQHGTFQMDHVVGYIPAQSTVHCTIAFAPQEPTNFYKRVVVLLKDRSPLSFDLLGSGFAPRKRPPPFSHRHVLAYRQRVARGLPAVPAPVEDTSSVAAPPSGEEPEALEAENLSPGQQWAQLFDGLDPARAITVDTHDVDFGSCSRLRMSDYKTVTVTNNTEHKVSCCWVMPGAGDAAESGKPSRGAFTTFPEGADLPPGGSQEFRIGFRPQHDNQYYSRLLECVAYVKTMRNFRLVTEETFCPPWMLTVQASGNTFVQNSEEFMPKAELSAKKLSFTPCHEGDSSYQTVALVNNGDTPVKFEFTEGGFDGGVLQANGPFECRPSKGVVGPHEFSLVAFKFTAAESRAYRERFVCMLNNSPANSLELNLEGTGFLPGVVLQDGGHLFFKPTCVGATSVRTTTIKNTARIPLTFEWDLPAKMASTLFVEPHAGLLRGNETATITWSFLPQKQRKYDARIPCRIQSVGGGRGAEGAEEASRVVVSMTGEGTFGAITMEPAEIDFHTVVVGHEAERTLTLYNQSSGNLRYALSLAVPGGDSRDLRGLDGRREVWLEEPEGELPARSFKAVKVSFRPQRRSPYQFTVACRTRSFVDGAEAPPDPDAPPPPTSGIVAHATYPTMFVCDAHCHGLAKSVLWQRLSLTRLNHELAADLTLPELTINSNKHLVSTQDIMRPLQPIVCDFGTAVLGDAPTVTHLELRNMGHLPVEFNFGLKDDQEVDVENWVEVAEAPDEVERHQNFIIENGVFTVSPRAGRLEEGESVHVSVRYTHEFSGPHELPVLLSVLHGKRVRIHLKGDTVDESCQRLLFAEASATLKPVALGEQSPAMQTFPLRNGGPTPIEFSIDTAPLAAMTAANYNFEVLKCLNPTGEIPVGGLRLVNFVFLPLEAKDYSVELPVTVVGTGETHVMSLAGRGYHPQVAGQAEERPEEDHDKLHWAGFQPEPALDVPEAPASLSVETVSMGEVPVYSVSRRLVVVHNRSSKMPATFEWDLGVWGTEDVDGHLAVVPASGRMEPGESVMCKLEYVAGALPQILDGEVKLVVTPIDEALLGEEAEARRPRTPADEIVEKHGPGYVPAPKVRERNLLVDRVSVIDATTETTRARQPAMREKFEGQMTALRESRLPVVRLHPAPYTLFVTLDGRVLPTVEYKRKFGLEAYERQFAPLLDPEADAEIPAGMAAEMIGDMLLDLVCDDTTTAALRNLDPEKVPTFLGLTEGADPSASLRAEGGKVRVPIPHHLDGTYREYPGVRWVEVTEPPTAEAGPGPVLPPPGHAGGGAPGAGGGEPGEGEGMGTHRGGLSHRSRVSFQDEFEESMVRAREAEAEMVRQKALLEAPEFLSLVEYVVESCVFSMMAESSGGAWEPPEAEAP